MSWSSAELTRIETLEEQLNKVQTAVKNLASKLQVRQLILLKQKELDALTNRVATLESQILTLQQNLE
jgi:polyhydroxyalkanoate synthesis regulator phasin